MSAIRLPAPGTKFGPCKACCSHRYCADLRREAGAKCYCCGECIGYDARFYSKDNGVIVHATCKEVGL